MIGFVEIPCFQAVWTKSLTLERNCFYIGRIGQKNAGAVQLQALRIPHFPVHNVMIVFFSEIYICPYIALCVVEASDKTVVF